MIDAYPLTWPAGWKRTSAHQRTRAKFGSVEGPTSERSWKRFSRGLSIAEGTSRVLDELGRFGISKRDIIISTNLRLRQDGLPLSAQRKPDDPGVAVYWRSGKEQKCMAIDRYSDVAENLAAVAATIAAMRAIERHGGAEILNRAFQGFVALPAPGQTTARGWREVLGVELDRPPLREVEHAYKVLRSRYHPDRPDGNTDKFAEVQAAWHMAQNELQART